jgi:hypothetical protein
MQLEDALSTSGNQLELAELSFGGSGGEGVGEGVMRIKKKKNKGGDDSEKQLRKQKKLAKRARKMEKAAVMLQKAFRAKFARAVAKRLRRRKLFSLAAQSGVLLACEGTKQGESGWYQQTEDSIPVFYEVNERGEWKLIM